MSDIADTPTDDARDDPHLTEVLTVAGQLDAERLSPAERANVAVTCVMERTDTFWPLDRQREILARATAALSGADRRTVLSDGGAIRPSVRPRITLSEPKADTAPPAPATPAPTSAPAAAPDTGNRMAGLASEIVAALSDILDFPDLAARDRPEQEALIRDAIRDLSAERRLRLNQREVADLVTTVLADMLGLGPLEPLLADAAVTDIMVNGSDHVYVERGGMLERTAVRFRDDAHVLAMASRIVAAVGRRIDESQPMVDARLKDGSRVNVAIPPLAIDGPTITIRKFPQRPIRLDGLVSGGALSAQMAAFLGLVAKMRLNVLISGGTGSGKTTLLNAISHFIPEGERLVTIEDAAELRLQQPHVVRFETRPPNVEGTGEVTMRTLVRNALRMRPDRIIIGEIRGDEVMDLLQAMNTGHDGSMSTLHANSPREALTRIEGMAALAGFATDGAVVRRQLTDALHLVVQVSRMRDGKRRITSISEVAGTAGDTVTLQELFSFRTDPASTRTRVVGSHVYSGYQPACAQRAADYGLRDSLDAILAGGAG